MDAIAIIPARGGSKRIPRKNLAPFGDRPALAVVVDTALRSGVFRKAVVSTDSTEVAEAAYGAGAEVVMRPPELADDRAPLTPVITHAVETAAGDCEAACLILATAVFITPEILRQAAASLASDPTLDYVLAVCRFHSPPQRGLRLDTQRRVAMLNPETLSTRSQDLEPLYYDAGMMTFGRVEAWRAGRHSFVARTQGIELDRMAAVDIDEPDDLLFAQALFQQQQTGGELRVPVLIRCDYFPGSGAGHLKRCGVLARALSDAGVVPVLLLDAAARDMPLPFRLRADVRYLSAQLDEADDAAESLALARTLGAAIVIRDSYRVDSAWEASLADAGQVVVALDDLGSSARAALAVNCTPGARRPEGLPSASRFLGGIRYLITDSPRGTQRIGPQQPRRVMVHAGGSGAFAAMPDVVLMVAAMRAELDWEVTWLCPNDASLSWLESQAVIGEADRVIGWREGPLWQGHDIVIGPASTSLYETIMQGALPISFPISATQLDSRRPWLDIGHMLHLDSDDMRDPVCLRQVFQLACSRYPELLSLLRQHCEMMDGLGASRVAGAIMDLLAGRVGMDSPGELGTPPPGLVVRPCQLGDADDFRRARNAPEVRALSTHPEHRIRWPEHAGWWLRQDIERFVVEDAGQARAYFWHRAGEFEGRKYLLGGWFPALAQDAFPAVLHLLQWQHARTARTHPDHAWIATVHQDNRAAQALDRRMGFRPADAQGRAAAQALFPGTGDDFLVMQKPPANSTQEPSA